MSKNKGFEIVQKIGQSLMLPVAVLPVAGILLGVGVGIPAALAEQNIAIHPILSHIFSIMGTAGDSIFSILPILFALATAISFANNDGAAALASLVGYFVFLGTVGAVANIFGAPTRSILSIQTVDMGAAGGIIVGGLSAYIFNRTHNKELPEIIGFFSGKRLVLILNALACMALGILMFFIWSPIGAAIQRFSQWAAYENPNIAFPLYGFFERLLLPIGVHHVWNAPFFFEVGAFDRANLVVVQDQIAYLAQNAIDVLSGKAQVADIVTGEIPRFLSGDPTAGNFAASYLFKMFGLPAAAIAMGLSARPEKRKMIMGMMISAALTSFITGITEPIEFSFLFAAPGLYLIHAFLVLIGYIIVMPLDIKLGTTFSQGLIDYILLYGLGRNQLLILLLGVVWAGVYFITFYFAIKIFNFKTPGRKLDSKEDIGPIATSEIAESLVKFCGGSQNITMADACITRLRLTVKDSSLIDESGLKQLGAKGVFISGTSVQAIFGPKSEIYKNEMLKVIK